jgi:two-component system C4-dicarboxylate transport sensor histidine kinase DctB
VAVALANVEGARRLAQARAELEHEKMRHMLVHAGKMVAMGRLASGIVHEMSHPVGAIGLLASDLQASAEAKGNPEAIGDIVHEAERLRSLIQGLRRFARADGARLVRQDLRAVLGQARQLYAPRLKTERVSYEEAVGEVQVEVDPGHLSLAIANLVLNAVDALAGSARKRIEVSTRLTGDSVQLLVRDTGPGIAEEVKGRLFEPFFTTKPEGQGLGLGLALSAESLAAMGGRIEADNHPQGGACFTIILPRATRKDGGPPIQLQRPERPERTPSADSAY